MDETYEILNEVIASINKCNSMIENVVVYQEEAILIRKLISRYARSLKKSKYIQVQITPEQKAKFEKILSGLSELMNTLQMISEDFWLQVALDWSIQKPINDLNTIMSKVSNLFNSLDIKVSPYMPSDDKIAKDLTVIYNVFVKGAKDNKKVQERLNSVIEFMKLRKIQIQSDGDSSVLPNDIFDGIQDCIVEHENYTIDKQIGFGASGQVFMGRINTTGEKVAIKQLNSSNLSEAEIESFQREIAVLSSLKHPYLVKFMGATNVPPYWILTEFMPGKSLFHRIRDRKGLGPLQNTIIAYEVAEGMEYLHSKKIIHRDLKTLNVLLDSHLEPRICDFGISRKLSDSDMPMTGLIGTFNYMAPEVISKSRYNLKADVFSFGLMLWEMIKRETPYGNKESQMEIGFAIVNGVRPEIPKGTPKALENLITDCWMQEFEKRPSFNQILRRMERENICFKGANEEKVISFYKSKISQRETKPIPSKAQETEIEKIFRLLNSPMHTKEADDFVDEIINSQESLICLKENGFIEIASPMLPTISNTELLTKLTVAAMDSPAYIISFLHSNGINSIISLLQANDKTKIKCGITLTKHCINSINEDNAISLLHPLLSISEYDLASKLLRKIRVNVSSILKPFLSNIISGNDKQEERSYLLSKYIASEGLNDELASQLTTEFSIAMGSTDLIDKLLRNTKFLNKLTNKDIIQISKTLSDEKSSQQSRECALLIANALPNNIIEIIAKYSSLILCITKVNNKELVSLFLYKICMNSNGAKNVLLLDDFLHENINNPLILSLFMLIGSFYPNEVLNIKWFPESLVKYLQERKCVETVLRVIGVLSSNKSFFEQNEVKAEIIALLEDADYTELEATLLLSILNNLTYNHSQNLENDILVKGYPYILYLSESNQAYSGLAFRILARFPLPPYNSHLSKRILSLIPKFIFKNDPYGNLGVGEFLSKFSKIDEYCQNVKSSILETSINNSLINTTNPKIFIKLCTGLKDLGLKLSEESLNTLNSLILQTKISSSDFAILNSFYETMK